MRTFCFLAVFFLFGLPAFGQQPVAPAPSLPKDPREVFSLAAPFYDFSSPSLKPWHLKATYQLFDENGKPAEKGTFEYWWASPTSHRSTWTRPSASHTDWYTSDGKHSYEATGEPLKYFEYKLESALLSPIPDATELDPKKIRLDRENISSGADKFPCIMVIPLMPFHGQLQTVPLGLFPTYCFDPQLPVLRMRYSFGTVTTGFNHIVKVQDKYLAREILLYEGKRQILFASVDSITNLSPSDGMFIPPVGAAAPQAAPAQISPNVMTGMLIKKQAPIYPQDAKDARVSGTVVLHALIGMDGGIHDLQVVSAPWPSLVASAMWSVSHWEYKPYQLNGQPVDVETTITVIYSLGN
jgi:TonB family protein